MIFGMDFGLKRIGLAKILNGIIIPMPPIIRKNRNQASQELKNALESNLEQDNQITIVVGIPNFKTLETQDSKIMQDRVRHFLGLINFNGKVIFIDEAYSSKEAQLLLNDRKYNARLKARKNGQLDSLSACIILQRYLEKIESKLPCHSETLC